MLLVVGVMALAWAIGFMVTQSGLVKADPKYTSDEIREEVLKLYPGEITELELEKEGKNVVYEIEIKADGKLYELKMDGDSGEVLKLEEKTIVVKDDSSQVSDDQGSDKVKDDEQSSDNDNVSGSDDKKGKNNSLNQTAISQEEAEAIALENFSGTIKESELDDDDDYDRWIYEIKVINGNQEAELDIDVFTGEVLMLEIETEDD